MIEGIKRSLQMGQLKMRIMIFDIDGTTGTVHGFDEKKIKKITKSGTGDYTVEFKYPYHQGQKVKPRAFVQALEANTVVHVDASDFDRITINVTEADGITAKDAKVSLMVIGSDNHLLYG